MFQDDDYTDFSQSDDRYQRSVVESVQVGDKDCSIKIPNFSFVLKAIRFFTSKKENEQFEQDVPLDKEYFKL